MESKVAINTSMIRLDTSKLEALLVELRKDYKVHVGILGNTDRQERKETINKLSKTGAVVGHTKGTAASEMSNADIGIIHEKGSKSMKIPRRSFIQMPLEQKLPEQMNQVGQAMLDGITKLNLRATYKKLGVIAENIIQMAFASKGYGFWASNTPGTIRGKRGKDSPLISTSQLRKSISSQVIERPL